MTKNHITATVLAVLGEKISSSKYPLYGEYVKQVYKYLPLKRFSRGDGK